MITWLAGDTAPQAGPTPAKLTATAVRAAAVAAPALRVRRPVTACMCGSFVRDESAPSRVGLGGEIPRQTWACLSIWSVPGTNPVLPSGRVARANTRETADNDAATLQRPSVGGL